MSLNTGNSFISYLRQKKRDHRRNVNLQVSDEEWTWTFVKDSSQNRVSNSQDETEEFAEGDDDGELVSKIEFDKSPFIGNPKEPMVRYSTRKPNYPTGYSCEHSLLYNSNTYDQDLADAIDMLSHSEESDDSDAPVLNRTSVRLSLEFEILTAKPGDYDKIVSNVEALQWSLLNEISARTGLSKGCKISKQHNGQSLVTALFNMNDKNPAFNEIGDSNDSPSLSNNNYRDGGDNDDQSESVHGVSSSSHGNNHGNNDHSHSQNDNNRRTRQLRINRSLQSGLPYPASVYSIFSTRPKWTGKCALKIAKLIIR